MAGIVLSAEAVAGIGGSLAGGILHDKLGGKSTIIVASFVVTASSLCLAESKSWPLYLIGFVIMNFFIGVLTTTVSAAVGMVWPEGGKKPYNLLYVSRNIGVAFGTSLGGLVYSFSFSAIFWVEAGFFSLVILVVFLGMDGRVLRLESSTHESVFSDTKTRVPVFHVVALLLLGLGTIFDLTSYIQWQTTIPIWMRSLGFSMNSYSLLWTLNGFLIIGLQPLISLLEKRIGKEHIKILLGQCFFIASFLVLVVWQRYSMFILAMILASLAEMIIWPAIPAAAAQMAASGREGFYQGMVNVFNYCGRLTGPIMGTVIFQYWGSTMMMVAMVIFYAIALVAFMSASSYRWFGKRGILARKDVWTISGHE